MLWISPEILRSGNIQGSKEADIYSFAIVCSELVNCEIAWHDPRDEKDIEGFKCRKINLIFKFKLKNK